MPELKCTVQTCVHNKNFYCDLDEIQVGGDKAKKPKETCCDSFAQRKGDSYTSAMEHPSRTISIDCEAVKCVYNSNYKCVAEHVDIKGCGACDCEETACATFKEA